MSLLSFVIVLLHARILPCSLNQHNIREQGGRGQITIMLEKLTGHGLYRVHITIAIGDMLVLYNIDCLNTIITKITDSESIDLLHTLLSVMFGKKFSLRWSSLYLSGTGSEL